MTIFFLNYLLIKYRNIYGVRRIYVLRDYTNFGVKVNAVVLVELMGQATIASTQLTI